MGRNLSSRSAWHLAGVVLVLVGVMTLAGCARDLTKVDVALGTAAYQPKPAAPYAKRYLPYAQIAALTYLNDPAVLKAGAATPLCPDPAALHGTDDLDRAGAAYVALRKLKWQCVYGSLGGRCPSNYVCVTGLGYQVWRRENCSEAVVAFRGTDGFSDIGDWISNLRWFTSNRYYDQYDQVARDIGQVVRDIRRVCPNAAIVATGHSLGGGLAQLAAYASPSISYVYAFDPSPVTGYFDIDEKTRERSIRRHGVERIYESAEVLSLPRYLASGVFPTPTCRPPVQIVRFPSELRFNVVKRHAITALIADMETRSAGYAGRPVRRLNAETCTLLSRPDWPG